MVTKVFFVTDLHGSEICFRKFLNAIKRYKANIAVLGGDLTGKIIVPIIEHGAGEYEYEFLGQKWTCNDRDIAATQSKIRNTGGYYYVTTPSEAKDIANDPKKLDELFFRLSTERLQDWITYADGFLRSESRQVYVTGGNDDRLEIDELLKKSERMIQCEGQLVELDTAHEMISTGYSNLTPWRCPRDITEEELARKIESMASQVQNMNNCVFNFHVPPVNSALDFCPRLDVSVTPPALIMRGGNLVMYGAGSTAVRTAIEKYQPLIGLHGHIHESPGIRKIGRTLCFNPGSEYSEGILRGAIAAYNDEKLVGYQMTSG